MEKEIHTNSHSPMHRQLSGTVVSAASDKTIHVLVKTKKMHPKYNKQYWVSKKYAVHDEKNQASKGDMVTFRECRPMSKSKKWRLVSVVS